MALNRELIIKVVWRGLAGLTASLPPMQAPFAVPSGDVLGSALCQGRRRCGQGAHGGGRLCRGLQTIFAVSPASYGDVPDCPDHAADGRAYDIKIKILQKEWSHLVADFQSTESPISMAGLVWGPDPDTNISIRLNSNSTVNPGKDGRSRAGRSARQGAPELRRRQSERSLYRAVQQRVADMAYVITPCAARAAMGDVVDEAAGLP